MGLIKTLAGNEVAAPGLGQGSQTSVTMYTAPEM